MHPLVSVLIPVYNCRQWVAQAIESALNQTWPNSEIIVLDDGSTDRSIEAITPYAGRIRIESSVNGGQNVSRNRLTALSQGEWLVYLDADDELAADCIEQKMKCTAAAEVVYGSSEVATFVSGEKKESYTDAAIDYADPWTAAFQWKYPNTSSCLFNRTAVLDSGGWNEKIKNCTDYDLYFRMLLRGCRFKASPDSWSLYRRWSVTQAVREAPLRLLTTRLKVMREGADSLSRLGMMTAERAQAFFDESLIVIRGVYSLDSESGNREYEVLKQRLPSHRPSTERFPANYLRLYHKLGFTLAERVAKLKRSVMPQPRVTLR